MTHTSNPDMHLRGLLLTTAGVLVLTPDSLLVRLITCDAWTLLFWRGLFQFSAILLFYLLTQGKSTPGIWKSIGLPGLLISCTYATGNVLFVHSIRTTSAANTLLIISAAPLIAALLSRIILKEKTPWRTWIATLCCTAGIAIILAGGIHAGSTSGDLHALVAACTMASSFVMIRKARDVAMIPAVAISGLLMSISIFPFLPEVGISTHDAGYLFVLGFVVMPVAFGLITLGPRYISAPEVSLIMLIETVLGPFWVWLAFSETPGSATYLGGAVVLVTLIAHSWLSLGKKQLSGQSG